MSGQGKVYKGDYGVPIEVSVGIDLTNVIVKKLKVLKPNGIKAEWTATVKSPATDGVLTYTTVDGDFDPSGVYKLHAYVTFTGKIYTGQVASFRIYDLWE